jgi:hypothetical protein
LYYSEWGHDFRPEYRKFKKYYQAIRDVPIIGLTATATPKVQDILKTLIWLVLKHLRLRLIGQICITEYEPKPRIESDIPL